MPNIQDPEIFKKNILAFEDMFLNSEIENFTKNEAIFSKISNIDVSSMIEYMRERRKIGDGYINDFESLKYTNLGMLLADIKVYVADVLEQNVELVTDIIRADTNVDGIITQLHYKDYNSKDDKTKKQNWLSFFMRDCYYRTKKD